MKTYVPFRVGARWRPRLMSSSAYSRRRDRRGISLPVAWPTGLPTGLPTGFEIAIQAWVGDSTKPVDFAASTALGGVSG
ncbi:MAG: hypothetical protein ABL997_04490 [Planctomycetota bacterium]